MPVSPQRTADPTQCLALAQRDGAAILTVRPRHSRVCKMEGVPAPPSSRMTVSNSFHACAGAGDGLCRRGQPTGKGGIRRGRPCGAGTYSRRCEPAPRGKAHQPLCCVCPMIMNRHQGRTTLVSEAARASVISTADRPTSTRSWTTVRPLTARVYGAYGSAWRHVGHSVERSKPDQAFCRSDLDTAAF